LMIPVISVIGEDKKKTTKLVESIVGELTDRGYKIGVIKHHIHDDFDIDIPGKPSYRHWKAGARKVAISSPTMFALISKVSEDRMLFEIVKYAFEDMDLVVTEGYKQAETPKLDSSENRDVSVIADGIEREFLKKT